LIRQLPTRLACIQIQQGWQHNWIYARLEVIFVAGAVFMHHHTDQHGLCTSTQYMNNSTVCGAMVGDVLALYVTALVLAVFVCL
jgi:hypothetical protein